MLLDPGDVALVELPAYTGAIAAFRNTQAELVGVRQESDGIDLGDLDRWSLGSALPAGACGSCTWSPNFQNPTGLLLGRDKRRRLLERAARHDLLLVEDDPYGELYFADAAEASDTRPIKADDRDGRVVYLSSFSKTLAPGYRVAWMAAPAELTSKFEVAKQAADICTGALDQRIVWQAIERGVLAAQAPAAARALSAQADGHGTGPARAPGRRARLAGAAGRLLRLGDRARPGSMPTRLLDRAMRHGVIFVVGSAFFVDGGGANTMRLSFSAPTPDRIAEGVRRLRAAVDEELAQLPQEVGAGGGSSGTGTPRG